MGKLTPEASYFSTAFFTNLKYWPIVALCARRFHRLANADTYPGFSMNTDKSSDRAYHRTSVDVAKLNATTVSAAGRKRTVDEFQERNKDGATPGLGDFANRNEFRRPTLPVNGFGSLKAGDIHDVIDRGQSEYSQRRILALTPNPTSNPLLDLSHPLYGLPKQLVDNFASLGIKSIYPWQSECLLRSGALGGGKNLVYTAPTGGGKSLVADILMLKRVIETPEKKALLVLPYVALVQEKSKWLRKIVDGIQKVVTADLDNTRPTWYRKRGDENSIRVMGFFGGSKTKATWGDMDIAVCTIEKVWYLWDR
jgi:hypothetical protein